MRVVVVGAGPAGAALSHVMARNEIDVTLLERHTDFAREFRGEGLQGSGARAIAQLGLGAELAALPQTSPNRFEIYIGERRAVSVELGPLLGDAGVHFVSQPLLLEMLTREAAKFPSFRLVRGFTVRDLQSDVDGRVCGVRGDGPDGPAEVPADLVIGADGRASVVRKRSALDRSHPREAFDVVWFKVPMPPALQDSVRFQLGLDHFCVLLPAPDGRLQIGWLIEKGSFGELRRRGVEEWVEELRASLPRDLADHLAACRGQIHQPFLLDVQCQHLREWSAPGLLLIGDAAHPMSPVGGQGINVALRDAVVAANHLVPVITGGGLPADIAAACRRTERERLPEVRTIQRLQRVPPRILMQKTPASRFVVRRVLPTLARVGALALPLVGFARRFARGTADVTLRV